MAVNADALRSHLGATVSSLSDGQAAPLIAAAGALLSQYVGEADVPDPIMDRAQLLVAAEMANQDDAPNGIVNQQYDLDGGGTAIPIRIGRDPMTPAYPLLAQWVSGKFFCA